MQCTIIMAGRRFMDHTRKVLTPEARKALDNGRPVWEQAGDCVNLIADHFALTFRADDAGNVWAEAAGQLRRIKAGAA